MKGQSQNIEVGQDEQVRNREKAPAGTPGGSLDPVLNGQAAFNREVSSSIC
jgi:hypothetical protein